MNNLYCSFFSTKNCFNEDLFGHYLKTINRTIIKLEKDLNKKFVKIEGYTSEDVKQEVREILYIKTHYYFDNIGCIDEFNNKKSEQCRFYTFIKKSVSNEIINRLKKQMIWENDNKSYIFIDSKYTNVSLNANENLLIDLLNDKYNNNDVVGNSDIILFFKENKENILTKKQLNYIDNVNIISKKHQNEYNRRIAKRVFDAYSVYNNNYLKINKINNDLKIIDEIFMQDNVEDILNILNKNLNNSIINELILNVDVKTRVEIIKNKNKTPVDVKNINLKYIIEYLTKKEIKLINDLKLLQK